MAKHSPKQASEMLEIPASSLRRYRSDWEHLLSEPDEKRRLTDEDIEILRIIRDNIGKKPREEIEQIIREPAQPFEQAEVFEGEIPPEPEQPQGAIQSIEFFSQVIDQLTDEHKTALTAKDEMITELKEDKDRLQNELSWLRLPWYRRLFKYPPK